MFYVDLPSEPSELLENKDEKVNKTVPVPVPISDRISPGTSPLKTNKTTDDLSYLSPDEFDDDDEDTER